MSGAERLVVHGIWCDWVGHRNVSNAYPALNVRPAVFFTTQLGAQVHINKFIFTYS